MLGKEKKREVESIGKLDNMLCPDRTSLNQTLGYEIGGTSYFDRYSYLEFQFIPCDSSAENPGCASVLDRAKFFKDNEITISWFDEAFNLQPSLNFEEYLAQNRSEKVSVSMKTISKHVSPSDQKVVKLGLKENYALFVDPDEAEPTIERLTYFDTVVRDLDDVAVNHSDGSQEPFLRVQLHLDK